MQYIFTVKSQLLSVSVLLSKIIICIICEMLDVILFMEFIM